MLSEVQEIVQGVNHWLLLALVGAAGIAVMLGDVMWSDNKKQIDAPDMYDVPAIEAVIFVTFVIVYLLHGAVWALGVWAVLMLLSLPVIGTAGHLRKLQAERNATKWSPKPPNRTKV